jgi:inhibitor of KinA sporulation pathway (predicted exonuclease)
MGLLIVDAAQAFSMIEGAEVMVRPKRNPLLSNYFQKLTGITQTHLDSKGICFSDALAQMRPYLERVDCMIFNGQDGQILRENCEFNGVPFPWSTFKMFNFRPLLAETLGTAPANLVSSTLPALAGIPNYGKAHTALDDCKAIAAALATWRQAETI